MTPRAVEQPNQQGAFLGTAGNYDLNSLDRLTVRRPLLLLALVTLACLVPFLAQPLHIDDPLFVWTAQQIVADPLDFYGFSNNWFGTEAPMIANMKNPPLASYYLAVVGGLFGFHAVVLHAAMLLPAVLVVWGVYSLARRVGADPLLSAGVSLALPVFLMSATMLMCDVLLLACWTWSVVLWIDGIDQRRVSSQAAAAVCMALAAMVKYYGVALIPLLLVYALVARRRVGWWMLWGLVPTATLIGYEAWTSHLYGAGLLVDAAQYSFLAQADNAAEPFAEKAFVALLFLGGCLVGVLAYAPRIWSFGWLVGAIVAVCLASVGAVSLDWLEIDGVPTAISQAYEQNILVIHVLVMMAAAVSVLALVLTDAVQQRDRFSLLLGLWVLGTFLFAGFLNWTVNGRSMLPMVPAVAILAARAVERNSRLTGRRRRIADYAPLAFGLIVGLLGAWGNYALASASNEAANQVVARHPDAAGRLWFQGHWGFQYAMERLGAKPFDLDAIDVALGDVIVVPRYNTNTRHFSPTVARLVEEIEIPNPAPVVTMRSQLHAGFYAAVVGRLPYVIWGRIPPDRYMVLKAIVPYRAPHLPAVAPPANPPSAPRATNDGS